jgi:hypothetical protein
MMRRAPKPWKVLLWVSGSRRTEQMPRRSLQGEAMLGQILPARSVDAVGTACTALIDLWLDAPASPVVKMDLLELV